MMLLVLLLASSGVVLASPRVKGSLLAQSGPSHPTYPNYGIAPRQLPGAYSEYKPIVRIEEHSANSDPNSVLVRINPQDLRYFQVQQSGSPSHSPSSVHRQTPDATFNVPSSQFNAKVNQGSFSSPSVQPVLVKERSSHPHVTQYNTASQDTGRKKRLEQALINSSVKQLLRSTPGEARLINTVPALPALKDRLIDNYTLIIENPVDTFRCGDKNYGYYADVDNNCQIFHVCVPFKQLYPANFTQDITFQFSFICNKHTIFSQDSMTCAWEEEALPCEFAPELYWMNKNFFRKVITPDGERYAHVNEPLP